MMMGWAHRKNISRKSKELMWVEYNFTLSSSTGFRVIRYQEFGYSSFKFWTFMSVDQTLLLKDFEKHAKYRLDDKRYFI